jgi:hypothetical protein
MHASPSQLPFAFKQMTQANSERYNMDATYAAGSTQEALDSLCPRPLYRSAATHS